MKMFLMVLLAILFFLAVSSGITKILLMQQDVEFFGKYGFSTPSLITFGTAQFVGGILLVFQRMRVLGAAIVAITFMISAVLLIMEGNAPFTIFTFIALLGLGLIVRSSLAAEQLKRACVGYLIVEVIKGSRTTWGRS